jgi:hypothetical protein
MRISIGIELAEFLLEERWAIDSEAVGVLAGGAEAVLSEKIKNVEDEMALMVVGADIAGVDRHMVGDERGKVGAACLTAES